MATWKRLLACAVLMIATTLLATPRAEAALIHPDLTLFDLELAYDGTNFSATTPFLGVLSWTNPDGTFGGVTIGDVNLTWNGVSGTIGVFDVLANAPLLSGIMTSFAPTIFAPGGSFVMGGLLTTTSLGLGDTVNITVGSTNFAAGVGTGQGDVTAVPEPTTLVLVALGLAGTVTRRRRSRAN